MCGESSSNYFRYIEDRLKLNTLEIGEMEDMLMVIEIWK